MEDRSFSSFRSIGARIAYFLVVVVVVADFKWNENYKRWVNTKNFRYMEFPSLNSKMSEFVV